MKLTRLIAFLLLLVSCAHHSESKESSQTKVIILHTNDIHGRAWPFPKENGQLEGGYAAQSSLISKIRREAESENAAFLLLSAGDVNTGVPESDFSEAKPDFDSMQSIGYDAMAVGNHDLDHGLGLLLKQASWVKFPFLAANLKSTQTKKPVFPSSFQLVRQGIQFGVLGLTTDDLPRLILSQHSQNILVEDSIKTAKEEVDRLKKGGSQILIALSHLGLSETGLSLHRFILNDDQKLAHEVPELNLIVGGHSHTFLEKGLQEGKTLIVQAGYRGNYLGRVDLVWDKEQKVVVSGKAQLIKVDPQEGEDSDLKSRLEPYRAKYEDELGLVVFETKHPIVGQRNQSGTLEIPLGNLICDALKTETGTDLAFFNSGGLRSSLPAGPVKKRDLLEAFPFKNQVSTGVFSGEEVISLLNDGLRGGNYAGGVLQVSGLSYEIKDGKVSVVLINGKPIDKKRNYSFSTNSYVFSAGDRLNTMKKARNRKTLPLSVDELLVRFGSRKKVFDNVVEGRILFKESH